MDLRTFDTVGAAEEGGTVELRDPEGNVFLDDSGKPITITVKGADSKLYTRSHHEAVSRRLSKRLGRGGMKLRSDEWDKDAMEILVKCTTSWSGIMLDGKKLEFTESNVRMVYTDFPWLKEQVDEFVQDRGNFLGNLLKSSSATPSKSSS